MDVKSAEDTEKQKLENSGGQGQNGQNVSRICAWSVSLETDTISLLIHCLLAKDETSQNSHSLDTEG